jgi:hypothetical protein
MFDAAVSTYKKYFGGGSPGLVVGVDIRDQSLPFMFEVMDPATSLPSDQYVLPINPETYRISHTPRVNATQTLGGVFEDNIGMGLSRIVMQGTFGYLGTLPGGHGKSLHGMSQDGWELFKEIEGIILRFYERFGTYRANGAPASNPVNQAAPPELRFYNYADEDYYVVQINRFDINRSIQRKFLYQYDIQMTVLRRLDEPSMSEDNLVEELNTLWGPDEKTTSLWAKMLEGYTRLNGFVSDVINMVESIEQDLATIDAAVSAFRQGLSDFIEAPFSLVQSTIKTVDSILETVASIEELPHEFTDHMRSTKRTLLSLSLQPDRFRVPRNATASNASDDTTVTEIVTASLPVGTGVAVVPMRNPETTIFDDSLETAMEVPAVSAPIMGNDTIHTIAHRLLGNASQWKRIAALNGLEYPFIVPTVSDTLSAATESESTTMETTSTAVFATAVTPAEGDYLLFRFGDRAHVAVVERVVDRNVSFTPAVTEAFPPGTTLSVHKQKLAVLTPGETILIPGEDTPRAAVTGNGSSFEASLYGTDDYLDDNGRHEADTNGSIGSVSGIANLEMQLRHRLMTVRGELASLGHPSYGSYIPLIIGRVNDSMWLERAKLEAKIAILEDPRVEKIGRMRIQVDGTSLLIDADVYPINQTNSTRMNIVVN